MRVVLEVLLLAGLIVTAVTYGPIWWRRWRAKKAAAALPPPQLSPRAELLAREDEHLREAVELRHKIAELAAKPEVGLGDVVVREVDELVAQMVSLHDTRAALMRHLAGLTDDRLARDAELLDAASVQRQRAQLETLRQRQGALGAELARAAAGLRETWIGLLDALAQPGGGLVTAERVRGQIETLRLRIEAEREARAEV